MYFEFKQKFGVFFKVHLVILFIVSKLGKLGVQRFKWCANLIWDKEVMAIWRQLRRVEKPWFRNSTYEFEIQFKFTLISNSPTATLVFHLLHLVNYIYGHSVHPKWAPHN